MNWLKWFLILSFTMSSVFAKRGGNGADVIVCNTDTQEKFTVLLDYYEANEYNNFPTKNRSGLIRAQVNVEIVSLVKNIDELRGTQLEEYFKIIEKELNNVNKTQESRTKIIHFTKDELEDIHDEGDLIAIPEKCLKKQLIHRRQSTSFNQARYVINETLFNQLSPLQQSMAFAHEFLYGEAIANGAENSINTRLLNGLYYSSVIEDMNAEEFFQYVINSEDKTFKAEFPYLVSFGNRVYQAVWVTTLNHKLVRNRYLLSSEILDPNWFKLINTTFTYSSMLSPQLWTTYEAPLFLQRIYSYEDGSKRGIGVTPATSLRTIKDVNGSVSFRSRGGDYVNVRVFADTDYIRKLPLRELPVAKKDQNNPTPAEMRSGLILERILAMHPTNKDTIKLTINGKTVNLKAKDHYINSKFPIGIREDEGLKIIGWQEYESDL